MAINTLVFDLDGTLLNQQGQLHPLTVATITTLQQFGHTIIYATGRSPFMASLVNNLPSGYFLCNNGAQSYHCNAVHKGSFQPLEGQLLEQRNLKPELAYQIIALARQHRLHLECNYATHTLFEYIDEQKVKRYNNPISTINAKQVNWDDVDPQHFIKFATMGEEDELQPFISAISASMPGELHLAYSYHGYLEISDPQLNKCHSLQRLLASLQLKFDCTMAFGDGGNDQQMLEAASVGVLMNNASASLKELPGLYRALPHDQQGVAHFLRCWFHLDSCS